MITKIVINTVLYFWDLLFDIIGDRIFKFMV